MAGQENSNRFSGLGSSAYGSRGSAWGQPPWPQRNEPPRPPSPPLGPVLKTLTEKDLTTSLELDKHPAKITECEYLASYNWLDAKEPTILVPGKPPAWTPPKTPVKLQVDSGSYFRDPNAARYPKHPTEPAVQAILKEGPADFSAASVDIVGCGSTFGSLLRFVRKNDKPFRMLVEVVGNTVFLIRRENSPTELIPNVRGYGHTFPEAYTTWEADVKGSESHQRIVKYTFGGLTCVVRFQSDGYLRNLVPSSESKSSESSGKAAECHDKLGPSSLSEDLSLTSLGRRRSASNQSLLIKIGGDRIPQDAVFDLKTRSSRKKDQDILAEETARLWIAQIPNFVVAYHSFGTFDDIRIQNVRDDINAWEAEKENVLRQFAVLIRKIITAVKSRSNGKLEIRRSGLDVLELREQVGDDYAALPPHIKAKWVGEAGLETGKVPVGKDDVDNLAESSPGEYEWHDSDENA